MTNLNDQNFNIFNSPAVAHVPDTAPVAAAAYEPPSFLVSSTQLSNEDLVRQYNVFINAIRYIPAAPELVFERLMSSFAEAYGAGGRHRAITGDTALLPSNTIDALLRALHDELTRRDVQATGAVGHTVHNLENILNNLRDIPATLATSLREDEPTSTPSMNVIFNFVTNGDNTGIRMERAPADFTSYPCNAQWPRFLTTAPGDQHGSLSTTLISDNIITFPRAFNRAPFVTCWLTGFETTELPLRAWVYTSAITKRGFSLHIRPSTLHAAGVYWLATLSTQVGEFAAQASGSWADEPLTLARGMHVTGYPRSTHLAIMLTQVDIAGTPVFPMMLQPCLASVQGHFTWEMKAGEGDRGLYLLKGAFMYH